MMYDVAPMHQQRNNQERCTRYYTCKRCTSSSTHLVGVGKERNTESTAHRGGSRKINLSREKQKTHEYFSLGEGKQATGLYVRRCIVG